MRVCSMRRACEGFTTMLEQLFPFWSGGGILERGEEWFSLAIQLSVALKDTQAGVCFCTAESLA